MGINGDKYNVASAISPFKHRIVSANPNFEFNNFVRNFQETTKMNRKNNNAFKNNVLEVVRSQEPASSRIFPTYNTNK